MSDTLDNMLVPQDATVLQALAVMNKGAEAIAFVCDDAKRILGLLTDGDVRRALLAGRALDERCLPQIMKRDFRSVDRGTGRAEVLDLMKALDIKHVPVIDENGRLERVHLIRELLGHRERESWAVIMAGGKGMRLRPLTEQIPKPMISVAGRPILERLVLHLVGYGISRIYLAVNYLAHVVEEHFGDGRRFGCEIRYLRESEPLGTGGALTLLPEVPEAPLLVVNGDLVTQFNLERLIEFHTSGGYSLTLGARTHRVEIPFGVMETDGSLLTGLREKPTHQMLVNCGIYLMEPCVLRFIPPNVEFPITELVGECRRQGLPVGAHLIEDDWIDVGRPSELSLARGHSAS